MGRRILVTGVDTFWGARAALALEHDPSVEMVLGMGTADPAVELERTEFVRSDHSLSLLSRIVRVTRVDTVVHASLVMDSTRMSGRELHESNVIGTMNLLAAAGATGSSVRQLVVKSSTLVYGSSAKDPRYFAESAARPSAPRTRMERSLVEVEGYVHDFATDFPDRVVAVLRFANVLGPEIVTPISRNLARRVAPCVAGFDPLLQFVEETDVVRALALVTLQRIAGVYNIAGDGLLTWSDVAAIADARRLWLPPVFTREAAAPLVRMGLIEFTPELEALLRFGRGVDTGRFKEAGFSYAYTTAGAVESFVQTSRLQRTLGRSPERYTYEADVDAFFKHSPAVIRD